MSKNETELGLELPRAGHGDRDTTDSKPGDLCIQGQPLATYKHIHTKHVYDITSHES
jgi:hypothetical protein